MRARAYPLPNAGADGAAGWSVGLYMTSFDAIVVRRQVSMILNGTVVTSVGTTGEMACICSYLLIPPASTTFGTTMYPTSVYDRLPMAIRRIGVAGFLCLLVVALLPACDDGPFPTATPAPTDTPTPVSRPTPSPTSTSIPTLFPTDTPTPTITPIPTDTPTPTITPTPTDTPTPTITPTETPTPIPTSTPISLTFSLADDQATSSGPTVTWTAGDPSRISHYEMAIGASVDGTDVLDWKNVGTVTSYRVQHGKDGSRLRLDANRDYYLSLSLNPPKEWGLKVC